MSAALLGTVLALFALTYVLPNIARSQQPASKWPVMDQVAAEVIQKYQTTTCTDLMKEKVTTPTPQEAGMKQKAVAELKENPEMREAFLDKIAIAHREQNV